jgi:WD40 repeat protein
LVAGVLSPTHDILCGTFCFLSLTLTQKNTPELVSPVVAHQLLGRCFALAVLHDPVYAPVIARQALMRLGSLFPSAFVSAVVNTVVGDGVASVSSGGASTGGSRRSSGRGSTYRGSEGSRESSLLLVAELIKRKPLALLSVLPHLAEAVVGCLNPQVASRRKELMSAATTVLQRLVSTYPQIDFHKGSQALAIGNSSGAVLVYDLKSATLSFRLQVDTPVGATLAAVTAVCFSPDPSLLCSYSARGGQVRVWKMGSGFFGIGAAAKCIARFPLRPPPAQFSPLQLLHKVRLEWPDAVTVQLATPWRSQANRFKIK